MSRAREMPGQSRDSSKQLPKHSTHTRHSDLERNVTLQSWLFSYIYTKIYIHTYTRDSWVQKMQLGISDVSCEPGHRNQCVMIHVKTKMWWPCGGWTPQVDCPGPKQSVHRGAHQHAKNTTSKAPSQRLQRIFQNYLRPLCPLLIQTYPFNSLYMSKPTRAAWTISELQEECQSAHNIC